MVEALTRCKIFLPILSRDALNSNEEPFQLTFGDRPKRGVNISHLTSDSKDCDSLILQYRLAMEMHRRGIIRGIHPVLLGDRPDRRGPTEDVRGKYIFRDDGNGRWTASHPQVHFAGESEHNPVVAAIETKFESLMDELGYIKSP